jgi:integrase
MPVLSDASCPARILSRILHDAVQRLPEEPGPHSVSNAAPAPDRRRSGRSAGPGFLPAHRGARAGLACGAPKTDAGRRIVAIPEVLIPGLRWHLACFVAEDDEGLLFTSTGGMPSRRSDFRNRVWLGAVKRAGLGELHFRDLRHQLAAGASTADGMIRLTLS